MVDRLHDPQPFLEDGLGLGELAEFGEAPQEERAREDRRLGMKPVRAEALEPHVTLEMKDEAGRPYFVDVFTWRDRDIPDHAPDPILKIWAEMTRLTEDRGGRPGVEIQEVTLASGAP